jgi:hypothetical protein
MRARTQKKKLVLAGHKPRQDEPDEPVPRFIMWVPQMNDRMPGIGNDALGARIRSVSPASLSPGRANGKPLQHPANTAVRGL